MARSVVPPGVRGPTPSLFLTGARDIFGEPLLVRAGQRLVGEVAQTMPQEGRALLALAGRRIWVQTQAQLDIGQVIRLQVAVANANRIVLQLTPEGTAAAPPAPRPAPAQLAQVLTRLSIPNTAANRDVVAGMLRQGLPLDPQLVQRLVAATRALPGNPAAALEAGLWLAARRLPISPTAVALVASEVRPNGEPVPVTDRLASARTALAALADEIPLPSPPRGGRPAASRLGAQPGQSDLAGQAPSGSSRGGTPAATANGASTAGTGGSGAPGQLPGSQGGAVAVGAAGAAARPAASVPAAPVAGSVPAATGQEVLDRLIAQPEAASLQAWVRYASTSAENRIAAQLPIVAEDASVPAQMRTGPGEAQMNPDGGGGGGAGMGGQEAEASAEMDTSAETDLGDAEVMAEDAATEDIAEDDSPDSEFDEGDGDLPEEDDSSDDEFDEEDAPEPDLPDDDPESEEEDLDAEEDDEDEPDFDESDDEASEEPDELEELDEPASRRSTSDARSDLGRLLQALSNRLAAVLRGGGGEAASSTAAARQAVQSLATAIEFHQLHQAGSSSTQPGVSPPMLTIPVQVGGRLETVRLRIIGHSGDGQQEDSQSLERFTVVLNLDLPRLGPLDTIVHVREDRVRCRLEAAADSSRAELIRAGGQLRTAWERLGYRVESLVCTTRSDDVEAPVPATLPSTGVEFRA